MTSQRQYRAFICYSREDAAFAGWLHRRLEGFRVPRALSHSGRETLAPVFRDREELEASADIGERLRSALARSEYLIVVCSPAAARSKWVNAEIETFVALRAENRGRVLAVLLAGEPASPEGECFPRALRSEEAERGMPLSCPLAADFRPGREVRRDAELRLIAALLGIEFDALKRREQERRIARLRVSLGVALASSVIFAGLVFYAYRQRESAQRAAEAAAAAERRAVTEADASNAISLFLQKDLLAQAAPDSQPDRQITLHSVLNRAAGRIEGKFPNQPLVEAALRSTLGDTFVSLTDYAQAEAQFEAARRLFDAHLGADDMKSLRCAISLTGVRTMRGDYKNAEEMGLRTLDRLRRLLGDEHPDTLKILNNLATLYQKQARYSDAERVIGETLRIQRRVLGAEHLETLRSMANAAALLLAQSKLAEAERGFAEAIAAMERTLGAENPTTLRTRGNLAIVYAARGKLGEAEAIHRDIIQASRRVLGPLHGGTLSAINGLAVSYHQQGRTAESEVLWREVLDAKRQTAGAEHPDTLKVMNNITVSLVEQNKLAEAAAMSRTVLEAQRKTIGVEHPDTLMTMHNLAVILWTDTKLEEAEELERETLALKKRILGQEHLETLTSLDCLGAVLATRGRCAEAEELAALNCEIALRTVGAEHGTTRMARRNLGLAQKSCGRLVEAERNLREALESSERTQGAAFDFKQSCAEALGEVLLALGRAADAERVLAQAVEAGEKRAQASWRTARIRTMLGLVFLEQRRHADAETASREGFQALRAVCERIPPVELPIVRERGERALALLVAQGQADKLEVWRQIVRLE